MSAIIEASQDRARANAAQAMPQIRLMQPQDAARWDEFVLNCPQASFFHRAGWQKVIEQAFGHKTYFYLAEVDGRIEGVLPLAQIKSRLFGHSLGSLPFCVYGGPAASSEEVAAALDQEAQQLADKLGVGHLEYHNVAPRHPDWHAKDLYVTFRKEMDPDPEKNMAAIPRKQRAMVRKGIKAGLTSEIDPDVERFFT